jgi:hypothetical protein
MREKRDEAVARADPLESKLADERAKRGRLRDAIEEVATSANEVATTASGGTDHGQSAQESATEALVELDSLTTMPPGPPRNSPKSTNRSPLSCRHTTVGPPEKYLYWRNRFVSNLY